MVAGMGFVLRAARQTADACYTPSQLISNRIPKYRLIRVVGTVVQNTVNYFSIADAHHVIEVNYSFVLPDEFDVGERVVVQGYLKKKGLFFANALLKECEIA